MFLSRLASLHKLGNFSRVFRQFFSQKSLNLSEPTVQKYFDYLLVENEKLLLKEERSTAEVRRLQELKSVVSVLHQRIFLQKSIATLKENSKNEEDQEIRAMLEEEFQIYRKRAKDVESQLQSILLEPFLSNCSILVDIVADEGDEAPLFVKELFLMYKSYGRYKTWIVDVASVDEAGDGFKQASLLIEGVGALELMNFENGVHHKIAKQDELNCISTAVVTILLEPTKMEMDVPISELSREVKEVVVAEDDSSSQNYVSLTHLPTDTFVKCKDYKSNRSNEFVATRELNTLLFHGHKRLAQTERKSMTTSDKIIRTYDCTRDRVMEHRQCKDGQHRLTTFMDGGEPLECLQESLLSQEHHQTLVKHINRFKSNDKDEVNIVKSA